MKNDYRPKLSIRMYNGNEKCFGPGIAELLERVDSARSLRAAAREMGMAYSKAWTIVKHCETALGFRLLDYSTGGKNGGGAALTGDARALLEAYRAYCADLLEASERFFAGRFASFMEGRS